VMNFDRRDHIDGRQQIVREGDGERLSPRISGFNRSMQHGS
jgi:hypothetical protein